MQGVLIAALLLAPAPDTFCDAVKQVVAAAPDDYRDVRGPLVENTSDSWHSSVTPALDESQQTACRVSPDDWSNGEASRWRYWCFTSYETEAQAPNDARVGVLADRVARCFGVEARTILDPELIALGHPSERRITVQPFEIVVRATRMEFLVSTGRPSFTRKLPLPYLSDLTEHDYWLSLAIRRIDPRSNGN